MDSLDRWRAVNLWHQKPGITSWHWNTHGAQYYRAMEILSALHKDATGIREALRFLVFNHLTGIARIAEQELTQQVGNRG